MAVFKCKMCGGIQACPGNPYDGHTLAGQLDQVERITGKVPDFTFADCSAAISAKADLINGLD